MNCLGFGNHVPDDEAGHLIEVTDATGALYNRARYYDPSTGRYDQVDPVSVAVHAEDYIASLIMMQNPAALNPLSEFPASAGSSLGVDAGAMPFSPDLNTYSYAAENPLLYVDPTGLVRTVYPGENRKDVPNDNPAKPKPAFPPASPICAKQCTAEYFIGVAKCTKSCRSPLPIYNVFACHMSWHTWLYNCQTSCSDD